MPTTIITFGDSTTAEREGVEVYTTLLTREIPGDHRWVNRGVPGNTTEMARARFASDVLSERPQVTIIQFGINDATVDVWASPPALEPRVSLARYQENLRYFIQSLRHIGASPLLMTPNPVRWTPALKALYGKAPYHPEDELGFTHLLGTYAEALREVARTESVPLVEIYERYRQWEQATGRRCIELIPDGMHPTSEGHRLVAEALRPVVQEMLLRFP